MTGKHTIFGRLVSGEDALQRMAKVDVDKNDRPTEPVLISRCGELEKRTKKAAPAGQARNAAVSNSRDRGRRRKSDASDVQMENSPEPGKIHQHRRKSDNLVDEGLRGRPRQRSDFRSPSHPPSVQEEDRGSDRSSPAKKHKRKRSPSPSRHANQGQYERRRRSLPNQYGDESRNVSSYEDDDRYKPSPRRDDYRHRGHRRDDSDRNRRQDDRYRSSREQNDGRLSDGRLGGGGYDEHEPPVRFKGRGVMKYREPDRAW